MKKMRSIEYWEKILGNDLVEKLYQKEELKDLFNDLLEGQKRNGKMEEAFINTCDYSAKSESELFVPLRCKIIAYMNKLQEKKFDLRYVEKK